MRSMFSGVSGMRNFQYELDVIGNNISNVNTVGFKGSRVTFQTALLQTLKAARAPQNNVGGTNPIQIGLGSQLATVDKIMVQGSFQNTGRKLDLAIQGDGFFVLSDGQGYYYTRAGALDVDMNGTLIHSSTGMKVQGWTAVQDPTTGQRYIDTNQPIGDIVISAGMTMPANATTLARMEGNLNSTSGILPFAMTVTDDNGQQHTVRFVFSRTNTDFAIQNGPFTENQSYTWRAYDESNTLIGEGYIVVNQFGRVVESGNYLFSTLNPTSSYTINATVNGTLSVNDATRPNGTYYVMVTDSNGRIIYQGENTSTGGTMTINDTDIVSGRSYNVYLYFRRNTVSGVTPASDDQITHTDITNSLDIPPDGTYRVRVIDESNDQVIFEGPVDVSNGQFTISDDGISSGQNYTVEFVSTVSLPLNEVVVAPGASISIPSSGELRFYESDSPSNFVTASFESPRYVTAVEVYDTLGNPYSLYIEFIRLGQYDDMKNAWIWRVYTASGEPITYIDANGQTSYNNTPYIGGVVDFNESGRLSTLYGITWDENNQTFQVSDSELRTIQFDASHMGDGTVTIDLDLTALTQFAGANSATFTYQNGNALGTLQSFAVNEAGQIIGTFSNGLTDLLGQVALAIFNNPAGLTEVGNSLYVPSANSGLAQIGAAGTGGRGTLIPGALEMSNVDLAEEFTKMIIAQRGFQANARVITTADTILGELVALRR
ncbi:MAG: flagellar hook-basal body complex protein [Pseudothermotoga sp.]|uniref:flagellar hook-basal body complex protein n=1 Tax=Pseudothermotoga sp. TaxID=2033661 RepID=UPI00258EFDC7|nr:flagellar hook-basal body complex protein [Pseudothermotoga sp.]MDI6861906.1 flagellar hook-basal body complex protein [Pseudothermotoga sp.]